MADQSVSVAGPVRIQSDCKERVALELAEKISALTRQGDEYKRVEYWFKLYSQCHNLVVNGWSAEDVLKMK